MTLPNKLAVLLVLCFLFTGCAKPESAIHTEYMEVKVPAFYKLERPERPVYEKTDGIPMYLLKLIDYITQLEIIIDEHNRKE